MHSFTKTVTSFYFFIYLSIFLLSSTTHAHSALKKNLTVMTFNLENGGTQVDFNQIVKAIQRAKADVVGIQEAWGNSKRLAKALKWKYYDPSQHVISRFPLFKADPQQKYIFIEVKPYHYVALANVHLPDEPYGPTLIQQGLTPSEIEINERRIRLKEAKPVIDQLAFLAKQGIPVFLTGDFNSPSHLDWTQITLHKRRNHRYVMNWPVTQYAANKGFIDSYRQIFPNSYTHSGYTWPAKRPTVRNTIDGYNPSSQDLSERIDFIFSAGPAQAIESQILGEHHNHYVTHALSPWPSDHRAVASRFQVTPSNYPLQQMKLFPITGEYQNKKPRIIVSKKVQSTGQPIKIIWENAPGYSYDYMSISPIKKGSTQAINEPVRLYTHGKINGVIFYSKKNVQGNLPNWYKTSHAHWPLAPGIYQIKLMLDDGNISLASTQIIIKP